MLLNPLRKKSYVGIDIGHKTINLVQIERGGQGWRIVRSATLLTPEDSVKDGVVTDTDAVGLTIKAALRDARISANAAICAVSGGAVIVRTVRVPKMNDLMLRKSIKYEAGRYVPSSPEDSYIEFDILGDAGENQMDVLMVAAPREMVNSRVEAIRKSGMEVDVVDVEAFAMYRALVEAADGAVLQQMTVALVDVGGATTTVSVVSRGVFVMTRTIPQAGHTMTEALKSFFKISDQDAENGKAQMDLRPLIGTEVLENQPLRVIQPHVDDLIREIRRSLNYYQSQQTEAGAPNPVTHLVLSGGGAKLRGLGEYMAHKLGVEVATVGVLDNPKFQYFGNEEIGNGMDISVASGLAMRCHLKSA
jgi:type IV pilus assembly protein PilM